MPLRIQANCPCRACDRVYFWETRVIEEREDHIYRVELDDVDECVDCDEIALDKFEWGQLWRHTDILCRDPGVCVADVNIFLRRSGQSGARRLGASGTCRDEASDSRNNFEIRFHPRGSGPAGSKRRKRSSGSSLLDRG